MQDIAEIEELIKLISKLPGLGPRSAKRIVLKLINNREELIRPMAKTLADVYKNIFRCKLCGSLKSNSKGCDNCENKKNKFNKICVVENIADQWSIEASSVYQGYFHILGGTISASNNQNKEDLLIFRPIWNNKHGFIQSLKRNTGVTRISERKKETAEIGCSRR